MFNVYMRHRSYRLALKISSCRIIYNSQLHYILQEEKMQAFGETTHRVLGVSVWVLKR